MSDPFRQQIIAAAFEWINTPYQHQSSVKGAGCDCLGLIRGLYRELCGDEPVSIPPYSPNWAEKGEDKLLAAMSQYLVPIDKAKTQPGDVLLFRMSPDSVCKHLAIMTDKDSIIHAYWGRAVVESFLIPYWRRRWAYSFAFPSPTQTQ